MTDLGRVLIAAAERNPHALAVVDGERRFDYAAWLDTASRVAAGLGGLGLQPGDRLAVIMQNRWEMAALHWACQLAGIVVVPLNWRSNADELDYFLTDSGAVALAFDESATAAVAGSRLARSTPLRACGRRARGYGRFRQPAGGGGRGHASCRRERPLAHALHLRHHRARQGRAANASRRTCGGPGPHRAELLPHGRTHARSDAALSHHGRALAARHGAGGWRLRLPTALRGGGSAPPDRGRADHRPLPGADALLRPAGEPAIRPCRYLIGAQIGFRRRADGRGPAAPGRKRLPARALRQPLWLVGDLYLHDRPECGRPSLARQARPASISASAWSRSARAIPIAPSPPGRKAR